MIGRTRLRQHRFLRRHDEAESRTATEVTIDLTTEARWFFDGPLPTDIRDWFTRRGSAGLAETRSDLYRVDSHVDLGLKRRAGSLLELKLRLGESTPFELGDGCAGLVERWQRWSPADERVNLDEHARWQAVDKAIVKRRFDGDGRERILTEEQRPMTGTGCDVEIVGIRFDGRQYWSFAFAAFGPLPSHRRSLAAAWETVRGDHEPEPLSLTPSRSCGYPEWLHRTDVELAQPG